MFTRRSEGRPLKLEQYHCPVCRYDGLADNRTVAGVSAKTPEWPSQRSTAEPGELGGGVGSVPPEECSHQVRDLMALSRWG